LPCHLSAKDGDVLVTGGGLGSCDAAFEIADEGDAGHGNVGDVVGTGSSRKSAINSVQWYMGQDIPHLPNKRTGGIVLGGKIAPIFFNTAEDSGALPIQCDVSRMNTGDVVTIYPFKGEILDAVGQVISRFDG